MKNYFYTILFCIISKAVFGTTYKVGSDRTYRSPNTLYEANVLQDGDIIEIDAEEYTGIEALAVWMANDLIIRGVGGRPHLVSEGQYIWGKGIWVLAGDNITVENIEFSGATVPDRNGAGIRLDGVGMIVRHCHFHDNENGILTSNTFDGNILIEYCEFGNNGFGDGQSHNLYIGHCDELIFRYNYSHHAFIGHNLKSRAQRNFVLYNRIMDEESGESSRLIDLSVGGFTIIMGNILMQGNNAPNKNLVGYGLEGLSNQNNEFYFINNTCVNKRQASGQFLDVAVGAARVNVTNNIFSGIGEVINISNVEMSDNVVDASIDNLLFIDEEQYNYRLSVDSPAIDSGIEMSEVNTYSLIPEKIYVHPVDFGQRAIVGPIDIGAYEYQSSSSDSESIQNDIIVYPNPFQEVLIVDNIDLNLKDIMITNDLGRDMSLGLAYSINNGCVVINTSSLTTGLYLIHIGNTKRKIIKF